MSSRDDFSRVLSRIKVERQSKKPFGQALLDLMGKRQISYPKLATATKSVDPAGKGLSHAYLHRLAHGAKPPPPHTITIIAAALNVAPEYFREFREDRAAQAAKALSSRIGYDKVMAALEALEQPPEEETKR